MPQLIVVDIKDGSRPCGSRTMQQPMWPSFASDARATRYARSSQFSSAVFQRSQRQPTRGNVAKSGSGLMCCGGVDVVRRRRCRSIATKSAAVAAAANCCGAGGGISRCNHTNDAARGQRLLWRLVQQFGTWA